VQNVTYVTAFNTKALLANFKNRSRDAASLVLLDVKRGGAALSIVLWVSDIIPRFRAIAFPPID